MTPETWDEAGSSTLTEVAKELAILRASQDEATLARLVAEGTVVRAASRIRAEAKFMALDPGVPFTRSVNLAIRPKRKKGRR